MSSRVVQNSYRGGVLMAGHVELFCNGFVVYSAVNFSNFAEGQLSDGFGVKAKDDLLFCDYLNWVR